jgi:hypothetical protein
MGLSFTIACGPRQRSHSRVRIMTIFYCLRFETPQTWRARSPYLYLPGTGWPSYTPRDWVPFSPPPTTRRATVEVFEPASTQGSEAWTSKSYHKASDRTSQETHYVSATKPNRLMLFREIIAVYCENHAEHTYTLWTECRVLACY